MVESVVSRRRGRAYCLTGRDRRSATRVAGQCRFFFFQAEDGIRDYKVTGVQTCALPISAKPVLAFLLDPDCPWPLSRVDAMGTQTEAGSNISRFRALLGTNYLAGIFRTPEDRKSVV